MAQDFAVISLNTKQYIVQKDSSFKVDRVSSDSSLSVLLADIGGKLFIGEPTVSEVGVKLQIVDDFKDKKISVRRFKSKSRYRKNKGHRQPVSMVQVVDIGKSVKTGILEKKEEEKTKSGKKVKGKVLPKRSSSISDLDVTDKIKKALLDNGYSTVEDVKNAKREDLVKIKGLGEKTVERILTQVS